MKEPVIAHAMAGSSVVAGVIDVGNWPHELMHDLAADVAGEAQLRVRDAIVQHREDIVDVLTQCVQPRLENWLAEESRSAMPI